MKFAPKYGPLSLQLRCRIPTAPVSLNTATLACPHEELR